MWGLFTIYSNYQPGLLFADGPKCKNGTLIRGQREQYIIRKLCAVIKHQQCTSKQSDELENKIAMLKTRIYYEEASFIQQRKIQISKQPSSLPKQRYKLMHLPVEQSIGKSILTKSKLRIQRMRGSNEEEIVKYQFITSNFIHFSTTKASRQIISSNCMGASQHYQNAIPQQKFTDIQNDSNINEFAITKELRNYYQQSSVMMMVIIITSF